MSLVLRVGRIALRASPKSLNRLVKGPRMPLVALHRSFSSESSEEGKKKEKKSEKYAPVDGEATETPVDSSTFLGKYADQIRWGTYVGGGSIVFYGISKLFYDGALAFLSLTPANSLKYGFYGGLLSTGTMAGILTCVERAINVKPERAFELGMGLANANEDLRSLLGGIMVHQPSDLKMYKSRKGSFLFADGSVVWKEPKCEMVLTGKGVSGSVTIIIIAKQHPFKPIEISFAGADVRSHAGVSGAQRSRILLKKWEDDVNSESDGWEVLEKMLISSKAAQALAGK